MSVRDVIQTIQLLASQEPTRALDDNGNLALRIYCDQTNTRNVEVIQVLARLNPASVGEY